ncbi:CLUMA_CG011685, isoform A [Clunio marinus]|uniref:CLUMA_CG011685, isoform A n=1 Tax=Clunio marinus TaxID=568069 RepID=A0A1J1IDM8_9DIPT|nr:CLUMA_CG011685, isoform A [Clunio marinus]
MFEISKNSFEVKTDLTFPFIEEKVGMTKKRGTLSGDLGMLAFHTITKKKVSRTVNVNVGQDHCL